MKKLFAAVMVAIMLCTLCACGAKETTPFQMKKEKGDSGYTCYGLKEEYFSMAEVEIPSEYNGKAVQYVGGSAFQDSDMTLLTISEGIESIHQIAFADCTQLESVRLPRSLTSIEREAFEGCAALKEIHIPEGVAELGRRVFRDCSSLETAVIEGRLNILSRESFKKCTSLKVIYLPETLTTIGEMALDGCDALEEIHFAGTVEEFLNIEFDGDWMSAENVLLCCADGNILLEDKNSWSETDRQPYWPDTPTDALSCYADRSDPDPDETMTEDWSDPGPDETMPNGGEAGTAEFVNASRTTQAIAPYDAVAMEHDGYIYYFDNNANLCRADNNMNNIELFCERPMGSDCHQDYDSVNIIGVSDTDVMYITGLGRSFVVDLASGQVQELVTGVSGEEVRLYGMSGEWIYYTRSSTGENTLYRSGLSDGFVGEEVIISGVLGDLKEIYVTDTYLVYVLDEGNTDSLYCAPLMDPRAPIWRDSGSGDHYAIEFVGADGVTAVYCKHGHILDGYKYYACDLASGNIIGGQKFPNMIYTYDGDSQRMYFFNKYLSFVQLEDFEDPAFYTDKRRYENENITSGWRIVCAGDWVFFRQDYRGGGADYCTDIDGVTFMDLRGLT